MSTPVNTSPEKQAEHPERDSEWDLLFALTTAFVCAVAALAITWEVTWITLDMDFCEASGPTEAGGFLFATLGQVAIYFFLRFVPSRRVLLAHGTRGRRWLNVTGGCLVCLGVLVMTAVIAFDSRYC